MNENFPIQGNDQRTNGEKPKTTFQKAYEITGSDGNPLKVLEVHISDEPTSEVYFRGVPEAYKGGAVFREELDANFIGDPIEQEQEVEE